MTIRITILIKRLPSVSEEDFHKYWSEKHASLFLSVPIVQRNLRKYQQFHSDPIITGQLRQVGLPLAEFDGGAELPRLAGRAPGTPRPPRPRAGGPAVFQDGEYLRVVVPDEMKFLDREKALMMIGTVEVKWEDGRPAEGIEVEGVK
ncbi:hypothetical protein LTR62_008724 [Meristemomyces frigidus]|uniref:EthD domain-containing protein n=1 Tax=Meristemomyces frigidus TaxID=1508187 RepID=A0AAN7TAF9_9PEZI|nr:hypothetical protein LTR62_008724 [Meristemomyces frigidus]